MDEINESENGLIFWLIYQINLCSFSKHNFSNCKESKWEWIYFLKFMTLMNVMSMSIAVDSLASPSSYFLNNFGFTLEFACFEIQYNAFWMRRANALCIQFTTSAYILEWSHQSSAWSKLIMPFVLAHKIWYTVHRTNTPST